MDFVWWMRNRRHVMRVFGTQVAAIDELSRAANAQALEYARHQRDMIAQFLVYLDAPETHDQLREVLHASLIDLSDQVARFEEHAL
jgi:hypothetical protein